MWEAIGIGVLLVALCAPLLHRPGIFGFLAGHKRVTLVVAHPDDEAMFFWPVLSQLQASGAEISVLCLSTGNFDGLGDLRRREMERSCMQIGVVGEALQILDVAELQDGCRWPAEVVAAKALIFLRKQRATAVLTFDNKGVSGHPNHISTSEGMLRARELAEHDLQFDLFLLKSVALYQKYIGPLSLLMLGASDAAATTNSPTACLTALSAHWSQLVWYRALFALASHYAYVNTFVRHVPERGDAARKKDQLH
ncbi:unnamed protein product [Effrenium voratum]|nr:unnamed protein product [Effrenium voratum]